MSVDAQQNAVASSLLTKRWTALRTHPIQRSYWRSPHRFNVVPAGRRSGKTEFAKRRLVEAAMRGSKFDSPRFFAAAPTFGQAKRIYWQDLKKMVPEWMKRGRPSESELVIPLVNDAEIHVFGMDKPERIEGSPWDGGILDEYGNMKSHAWTAHVRPALSDRTGWCDLIGVPEGRNHYYDTYTIAMAEMMEYGPASEWGAFTWKSADILPASEIEAARRDLDELTYQQEYEASFVTFTGRVYYTFDELSNCARLREFYDPDAPLIIALDFNVAPGVATVGQEMVLPNGERGTAWLGEVYIEQGSTTPMVCRRILEEWNEHRAAVRAYGDATGGARGTAKVEGSDWDLVRKIMTYGDSEKGLKGFGARFSLRVPPSNPPERARVNAVNSRFRAVDGTVKMMVDPYRCPRLKKDLEGVRVKEGTNEIDKTTDKKLTHLSDAIGYYVDFEFPVREHHSRLIRFKV